MLISFVNLNQGALKMKIKVSKKGFTLVEIMIVVVIIGILAALAIPAFQKVRSNSQKKAILNNLRQIAGAGQQFILDPANGGPTAVSYDQLHPTYFPTIKPVAGENYSSVTVEATPSGPLSITSAALGGEAITFAY